MRFMVNPGMVSVRRHGKPASRKAFHAAGYTRNAPKKPSKRQLAARRKFATMAKARAAAARRTKRASTSEVTMAGRKRKAAHRRKSVRRVGRARRRHSSVVKYAANPRRRRRSGVHRAASRRRGTRRYRRNPGVSVGGIKSAAMSLGMGLAGGLGGMALGNFITTNITPKIFAPQAGDTAQSIALRQAGVVGLGAIAVLILGKKVAPPLVLYSVAIGMMLQPAKAVIYAMSPAGTVPSFLGGGSVAMPAFRQPNGRIAAYPQGRKAIGAYPQAGRRPVGAYPQVSAYPQQSQPY